MKNNRFKLLVISCCLLLGLLALSGCSSDGLNFLKLDQEVNQTEKPALTGRST